MASENLSSDIIFEVLTRTKSLKTLDTCKTVCNEWGRIIKEPSFFPNYCERTNNVSGYVLQDTRKPGYVSQFVSIDQTEGSWSWSNKTCIDKLPHDAKILASCDQGILCCTKQDLEGGARRERYYACKPSTKQWQKLPNPKTRLETTAVAIMAMQSDEDYLRYKIVRLSQRRLKYMKGTTAFKAEIFDSGAWSWSGIEDVILPYDELIGLCPAVEVNSSLYWLTTDNNVLVFRSHSNSFDKFSLPEQVKMNDQYGCKTKLLEYKGKLSFAKVTHENDMELWVMDDQVRNSWVKIMTFNLGQSTREQFLEGFRNANIGLMKAVGKVVFHKLENHSYDDKITNVYQVFGFRSDVEPVNLRPKFEEASKVQKSSKKIKKIIRRRLILLIASICLTLARTNYSLFRLLTSIVPCI